MTVVTTKPAIIFTTHSSTTLTTVDIIFLNEEFKQRICSPDKEIKFDFTDPKGSINTKTPKAEQYALASWLGYLDKEPYSLKRKLMTSLVFKKDGMTLTCHKISEGEIIEQIKKVFCAKFGISADEIQKNTIT
jgi:hypothetical protein